MDKVKQAPYYIGLDMGTSSVGWAVTDEDYKNLAWQRKKICGACDCLMKPRRLRNVAHFVLRADVVSEKWQELVCCANILLMRFMR